MGQRSVEDVRLSLVLFEHSIPELGESQGMLGCGFVMLDMVDPSRQTDVVRGCS